MADQLRWGVLSTANIGVKSVIPALQASSNGEVVAISSRNRDKAREVADKLAIAEAYGSYEELLASDIDAVYNPLPNSLHKEWTLKALGAGKHVLCEKPLGISADECEEMAVVAKENGVLLMEAFMYRFHPRFAKLTELLERGTIGELMLVRSTFSFKLSREDDIRWQPDLGGGALYDVGCYCVSMSRTLAGEEPVSVQAYARWSDTGVDEVLAGALRFPNGVLAQIDCGFALDRREFVEVVGSEGRLELTDAFTSKNREAHITEKHPGQEDETHRVSGEDPYKRMAEHFAACVLDNKPLRYPVSEAAANMRTIEALYRAARKSSPSASS